VLSAFNLSHLMKVQAELTAVVVPLTGPVVMFSGPGFLVTDGGNI